MRSIRLSNRFLLCLLILASVVACTGSQSTWDRVQNSGVLRVGTDPTYPPFAFSDGETIHGIDVDLAHAAADELGLSVTFSHFGFDGLYDALSTEQVDVLISALIPDITRTRDFAYSQGYVDSGLVLVSPAHDALTQVEELEDKIVAVELGAAGHVEATVWQRQLPNLTLTTHPGSEEALLAVVDGQAHAAVVDNISFRIFAGSNPDPALDAVLVTSEPYAIVVRSEDRQLLREIDRSLAELRSDGRLDAILNSWFLD